MGKTDKESLHIFKDLIKSRFRQQTNVVDSLSEHEEGSQSDNDEEEMESEEDLSRSSDSGAAVSAQEQVVEVRMGGEQIGGSLFHVATRQEDEYEVVQHSSDQSQDYFSAEDEDQIFEDALQALENSSGESSETENEGSEKDLESGGNHD